MTVCPGCGAESEKCYRCSECGRDLADTEDHDDRELMADGGQIEQTTDEIVVKAIDDLQDEGDHGAPIGEVVQVGIEESEVRVEHVFETITWLYDHGEIYQPARGYLRRTDAVEDLRGESR